MSYGVVPEGFSRKPLPIILAEIEAAMITEFGPDVIQTSQSPLGQINGLMADLIGQMWELVEDSYQSYDPDQAEGIRLDVLARIRLLMRAGGESDQSLRQAITNQGRARIDVQDVVRVVRGLDGVTYAELFINETNDFDESTLLQPGQVAVAIIGGDDEEIAAALRAYTVPGVSFYGNTYVTSEIEGRCRTVAIVRPIEVPVTLNITVRMARDFRDCPPPAVLAVRNALVEDFLGDRLLRNGDDITFFRIRSAIEGRWPNVEVVSFIGERDGIAQTTNEPVDIAFIEIARVSETNVTVTAI